MIEISKNIIYIPTMPKFLITLIVTAISMMITSYLIPGIIVSSVSAALVGAIVFGIVNAIVKPILVFFTLPATILTLGLFLLIINGICFALVAYFTPGFAINGFLDAIFGSIVVSLISGFLNNQFSDSDRKK